MLLRRCLQLGFTTSVMIASASLTLVMFSHGCRFSDSPIKAEGFLTKAHIDSAGRKRENVLFLPHHREQSEKLPVILFLNGKGENGNDGLRQVGNNFGGDVWRMRNDFPFLAVCPQCQTGEDWSPGGVNAQAALAALDRAVAEFNGDPDRVYLTGPSDGGKGALELVAAYPNRFAAVVPIATGMPDDLETFAAAGTPIWIFYNGRDEPSLVKSAREMRKSLLKAGLSPLVTEFDRAGHNAWDIAYGSPVLYGWLLEQNLRQRESSRRFELLSPNAILETWERHGDDVWSEKDDELRFVAPRKGDSQLFSLIASGDADLHLDVYLNNNACGRIAIVPADDRSSQVEVVLQLPAAGTGGLRVPDGWQDPLDPIGQRALRRGWNDVRLSRLGDRWRVRLNGWPALEFQDASLGGPIRWALVTKIGDAAIRWRYVRVRGMSAANGREDAT